MSKTNLVKKESSLKILSRRILSPYSNISVFVSPKLDKPKFQSPSRNRFVFYNVFLFRSVCPTTRLENLVSEYH